MSVRSNFKPMPADHIDDEDERCRVRHDAFVAKQRHARKRPSDFWFFVCVALFVLVGAGTLYLVFTHSPIR